MGNIYGVANSLAAAAIYVTAGPSGDVSVTAGSETTFITTGALVALNPGNYYPLIWLASSCLMGGTAATALVYAARLGSAADFDSYTVNPAKLTNNATVGDAIPLLGSASTSAWLGSGSTINITVTSTGQNVTIKGAYTRAVVLLMRGSD